MKTIFFTVSILLLNTSLYACNTCISQVSQTRKNFATRTVHQLKKVECNCPCTGPRSEKNECLECEHSIGNQSFFFLKSTDGAPRVGDTGNGRQARRNR